VTESAEYEIGRRTASFARSLFVGMGGDPIFRYTPSRESQPGFPLALVRSAWLKLRAGQLPRPGIRTALRRRAVRMAEVPDWINPTFASRVDLRTRWRELHDEWAGSSDCRWMLHPMWARMFALGHPGARGLPYRTLFPFFDLRVAQYAWAAPVDPWHQSKLLLREAMRERLPAEILERPKTLAFVLTKGSREDSPAYQVALRPESRRIRAELLSSAPVGEYLDLTRARQLVESPVPGSMKPSFDESLLLAAWLRSVSEHEASSSTTNGSPRGARASG
jgi:hypothetical protein